MELGLVLTILIALLIMGFSLYVGYCVRQDYLANEARSAQHRARLIQSDRDFAALCKARGWSI